MMKNSWLNIILFAVVLALSMQLLTQNSQSDFQSSYEKRFFNEWIRYIDKSNENERTYIEDEHAHQALLETYQIEYLIKEEIYEFDNNCYLNFYFDEEVASKDIDSVMSVYSQLFFGQPNVIGYMPYLELAMKRNNYKNIQLRLFVADTLIVYKGYDLQAKEEVYYENMDKLIKARKTDKAEVLAFETAVLDLLGPHIIIETQKPLKPFLYHFKIISKDPLETASIEQVKRLLENDLALPLERESKEIFGMNANALGLVIQLETLDASYKDFFYFNGEEKKWIEEDWMLVDLFLMNGKQ